MEHYNNLMEMVNAPLKGHKYHHYDTQYAITVVEVIVDTVILVDWPHRSMS